MKTNFRNKIRFIFPHFLFLLLIMIALHKILFTPGIIGHTWDWNIPPFPGQIITKARSFLFAWNDTITLGHPDSFPIPAYLWFLILPFSSLGGDLIAKGIIIFLMVLSASSMFSLCRRLRLNYGLSLLPAIFYMFSPVVYSRIVAGHLPNLFGYALLPLFVLFLYKSFEDKKFFYPHLIITGILFALTCSHPMIIGVAFVLLLVFSVIEFFSGKKKVVVIKVFLSVLFIFLLLHSSSASTFLKSIFIGQPQFKKYHTIAEEAPLRMAMLRSNIIPLVDSLRLSAPQGMHTEYIFPPSPSLRPLWIIASCLLPILVFSVLFIKPLTKRHLTFIFLALLGVTLSSGLQTPLGVFLYKVILLHLGPVFFEYSNPNRFNVLSTFSYAVLLGLFLYQVHKRGLNVRKERLILLLITGVILIYASPFLCGNLSRPQFRGTQPLSLLVTRINPQDRVVYDFLKDEKGDFRVSYLPPAMASYVGETDLSYEWTSAYSPKPEFIAYVSENLSRFLTTTLYQSAVVSTNLGQLFGLANVKYIIFPRYEKYYTYRSFGHLAHVGWPIDAFKPKKILERAIAAQRGIKESNKLEDLDTITLYENREHLPHIYPVAETTIVSGNLTSLISLGYLPGFSFGRNGLLFSSQLKGDDYPALDRLISGYLLHNNNLMDLILPLLSEDCVIYPGLYARGFFSDWSTLEQYWHRNWHYSASLHKNYGAYTFSTSELEIPYYAKEEGAYEIYASFHLWPQGSRIDFSPDSAKVGSVETERESDLGFQWVRLGTTTLTRGSHTLRIEAAEGGENTITCIIVAPVNELKGVFSKIEANLNNKKIVLLTELEQFKKGEAIKDSSGGYAISPPVKGALYAPREGRYGVSLRVRSHQGGVLNSTINGRRYTIPLNPIPSYRWYYLRKISLNKGFNDFSFSSNQEGVYLDLILAQSDAPQKSNPLGLPRIFDSAKINPCKYEVRVGNSRPFFLFFSESFDPRWQVRIGSQIISGLPAYGFGNLYYIDKTGTYTLNIEYATQRYFRIGQGVTLSSWIILLSLLVVSYIKERKRDEV